MRPEDVQEFLASQKNALCAQLRAYLLLLSTAAIDRPELNEQITIAVDTLQRLTAI